MMEPLSTIVDALLVFLEIHLHHPSLEDLRKVSEVHIGAAEHV